MAKISRTHQYICPTNINGLRIYDNASTRTLKSGGNTGAKQSAQNGNRPRHITAQLGLRTTQPNSPLQQSYIACVVTDGYKTLRASAPLGNRTAELAGLMVWKLMLACVKPNSKDIEHVVHLYSDKVCDIKNPPAFSDKLEAHLRDILLKTANISKLTIERSSAGSADLDALLKSANRTDKHFCEITAP